MQWLAVCVLATTVYGGGGVTQTSDEQFWPDYKVLDQVYGKVFDRDIYGDTLPPSIRFERDKITQASEKKVHFVYPKDTQDSDPYTPEDKYEFLKKDKPATPTFNFLSYNGFKPISQSSDPETYEYLKRLEQAEKKKKSSHVKDLKGIKAYKDESVENPEETYAYKVIQNILEAHEANKGKEEEGEDNSKYLTYRKKENKKNNKNNVKKPPRVKNAPAPRCVPGRCRKRSSPTNRVRSRPYYRRIKHRIY